MSADQSAEERKHAQFLAEQIARTKARETEAGRRKDAFAFWCGDNRTRLGLLPMLVRGEVESMAWVGHLSGQRCMLTADMIALAEARVVSQLRVRRYGRIADDPEEQVRQWREIGSEVRGVISMPLPTASELDVPAEAPAWLDEPPMPDEIAEVA